MLTERNNFLDVLKGIAILFVIVTHYDWSDPERLQYLFPYWIDMCVLIFMIISGYVNSKSFNKKRIATFEDAYALKNIIFKLIRYTIPFMFAYVIECIVFLLQKREMNYLFLFLQGAKGPGSYYYPIIIQFVFMFPVVYFIVQKYKFRGLQLCFAVNVIYELLQSAYGMNEECYRLLVFRYLFAIAFGTYLSFFEKETIKSRKLKLIGCCSLILGAVFIFLVSYTRYQPVIIRYWTRTSCIAALYIAPIMGFLILRIKFRFKLLEIIGKASYNILFVQMIYYTIAPTLYAKMGSRGTQLFISMLLCIVGGVIFYYVETPITKRIIHLFE